MGVMSSAASRLDRITVDPAVLHGKPAIRGLRLSVQSVLDLLASGMSFDEVLADYPDLQSEDLLAALEYGALVTGGQQVRPSRS
ncbi:hypothetical protein MCHIJ_25530 [Mycolicibacterium chitae]|uniref:Ssl5025 protein n=2 Tax=Mycolicibacterium chitae TaxID=1792 RepID=A0A3S4RKI9_MYCCI|nr:DUF433 domain-containing protein [Mycolicibacterium chitae]BBZ03116.1 hypothetical protein MCHIJ_25530 [Mycolicibacterium chitae]VEG46338.1 Ssl5025 protein [Mycolicibacterium chitae]